MKRQLRRALRSAPCLTAVVALFLGTLLAVPATAAAGCSSPPAITPENQLTPGTTGTAWTVVQGTTPVSFNVDVLGTLPDFIAPGVDLILIQVSGSVIDQVGGIAAGMSGSPVYVSGKLAGAISYGFFAADHTIGGMTPAQSMIDILSYPNFGAAARTTVHLGTALRHTIAGDAGIQVTDVSTSAGPLPLPFSVSGLSNKGAQKLQRYFDRHGNNFIVTQGAAAPVPSAPIGTPPAPGDAIGAVYSFGDITSGAIGTATAVCDNEFVAFGHPFDFNGKTSLALTGANIVTTVNDPSGLFGPFKIGNIGALGGTVTQDRLTGIAGVDDAAPALIPVTSDFTNPELAKSRTGETDVAYEPALSYLAAYHLYSNWISVIDQGYGPGTIRQTYDITGTDGSGNPFEVGPIDDLYFSSYSPADRAAFAVYRPLYELENQKFTDVTFTGVTATGTATTADLHANVVDVLTSTGLQPNLRSRSVVKVRHGGRIQLQVVIQPADGSPTISVPMTIHVPGSASGDGSLNVNTTGSKREFQREKRTKAHSFDELVAQLNDVTPQFDIVTSVSGRHIPYTEVRAAQNYVMLGSIQLGLHVAG